MSWVTGQGIKRFCENFWGERASTGIYLYDRSKRTHDIMANHPPDDPFEVGLESLRQRKSEVDLSEFEHRVWSEIALRDERGIRRLWSWLQAAQIQFPVPVAATFGIVAIAAGSLFGVSQANAYGRQSSLALEQRYVESIHPVLMSSHHVGDIQTDR